MFPFLQDKPGYLKLMEKLLPNCLRPGLVPVHMGTTDLIWKGSGTLVIDENGAHRGIVTAAHIFAVGTRSMWFFQTLQPFSDEYLAIAAAGYSGNPICDIGFCVTGKPNIITGFADFSKFGDMTSGIAVPLDDERFKLTSLVTGEVVDIIGIIGGPNNIRYMVMDYESSPGQSGAGFITPLGPKELYVLKGACKLSDELKAALPKARNGRVSICTPVLLK